MLPILRIMGLPSGEDPLDVCEEGGRSLDLIRLGIALPIRLSEGSSRLSAAPHDQIIPMHVLWILAII